MLVSYLIFCYYFLENIAREQKSTISYVKEECFVLFKIQAYSLQLLKTTKNYTSF